MALDPNAFIHRCADMFGNGVVVVALEHRRRMRRIGFPLVTYRDQG